MVRASDSSRVGPPVWEFRWQHSPQRKVLGRVLCRIPGCSRTALGELQANPTPHHSVSNRAERVEWAENWRGPGEWGCAASLLPRIGDRGPREECVKKRLQGASQDTLSHPSTIQPEARDLFVTWTLGSTVENYWVLRNCTNALPTTIFVVVPGDSCTLRPFIIGNDIFPKPRILGP